MGSSDAQNCFCCFCEEGKSKTTMCGGVASDTTLVQYCQSNLGGCLVSVGNWTKNQARSQVFRGGGSFY